MQSTVCPAEFAMFGRLVITLLDSAKQKYVQLIFVVVSTINYPNCAFTISPLEFLSPFARSGPFPLDVS